MIKFIPLLPSYVAIYHKWRCEKDSLRYNPLTLFTIDELHNKIKNMSSDLSKLNKFEEFRFIIEFEGKLIGSVGINNINHMMMYCEISYIIGEDFQGNGFGSEAVKLFIGKIFRETYLRKILAYVAEGNLASRRIMEKTGFSQEGLCREHYIINGKPVNEILYGILRADYEQFIK